VPAQLAAQIRAFFRTMSSRKATLSN